MAYVNIGSSDDPFYRYRRPKVCIQNISNKTIITNLESLASALHTKPLYIVGYIQIAKSISITPKMELKAKLNQSEIETLIEQYIEKHILCSVCRLPEIVIEPSSNKLVYQCQACGNQREIIQDKFSKIIYRDYQK